MDSQLPLVMGVVFAIVVGYFAGSAAADVISKFGIYAFVALGVLFVVYAYVKLREHQGQDPPAEPDSGSGPAAEDRRPRDRV